MIGGIALLAHGYRRTTINIDALITEEGLAVFHSRIEPLGYETAFEGARKTFLDTETGVRVKFLISGTYPGLGGPKPVRFPTPGNASLEYDGYRVITLAKLIELKLTSGGPGRLLDWADVQALIEAANVSRELAAELHPSVHAKFDELWELAQMPDFHNPRPHTS